MIVRRSRPLRGTLAVPADKSITHRAWLISGICREPSRIREPLEGEDCQRSKKAIEQIGAAVERTGEREFLVSPGPFRAPTEPIDCGNSGTTMRLLAGVLAGAGLPATMVGDASLSRRPMGRIVEPLRAMGAEIEGQTPPLRLGTAPLAGIRYRSPVASAQVKSCLLLAGLFAVGDTWVSEPTLSRDHTERMLAGSGVDVLYGEWGVGVQGGDRPLSLDCTVPGDISSAAFWLVAGALVPGSDLTVVGVGVNDTRTGVLDALNQAGVVIEQTNQTMASGEPVADLRVCGAGSRPMRLEGSLIPRLIDEIPALAVLATQLPGETVIRDAGELRVKESDRIQVVSDGLRRMGAKVQPTEDGMIIEGATSLVGADIDATGDHRIAMAFAIAGLVADGETKIHGADSVSTSYPTFFEDLKRLQG